MRRRALRELLRELRQELPAGVRRDFEDGLIDEFEAAGRLERLLGPEWPEQLRSASTRTRARDVDGAVLRYQRRRAGREAWTRFEVPEEDAA